MLEVNALRLKENRWQKTENTLMPQAVLDESFSRDVRVSHKMTFAIDASSKHDCTALVGSYEQDMRYVTGYCEVWTPRLEPEKVMDLEATVVRRVVELYRGGLIYKRPESMLSAQEKKICEREGVTAIDVHYDPTQMHQAAMTLRKKYKLLICEFSQAKERLLADTFLLKQYESANIDNLDSAELKSHLSAAKAESQTDAKNSQLIRIVKGVGQHAKPIDAAVAQSMSVYRTSKRPRFTSVASIPQAKVKGWQ
jgi:hypothetical protein